MKVTIITVKFLESDIYEGSLPLECYDNADEYTWHLDDVEEVVEVLKREGLTFSATGGAWAADPDGSFIADYVTGERHAKTGHIEDCTYEQEQWIRLLTG